MTKLILTWIALAVLVVAVLIGYAIACKWLCGVIGWTWPGAPWLIFLVVMWYFSRSR